MGNNGRYFYGLGIEYMEKDQIEEALVCFYKSSKIESHFKTYERIYQCLNTLGKKNEATGYIEKAYNANKSNDKVAFEYASLLFEEGHINDCTKILKEILQRNSSYGPARQLLNKINT